MPYALGIDLGTARTTAAVSHNRHDSWSEPAIVPLEDGADHGVATVLLLTSDDAVEVGEAAIRGAAAAPDRVARDFLDRIGDEIPIALGAGHYPAESLAAALVAWVVDRVEAYEGSPASRLVVTHPVSWGAHRRSVLQAALRELNLPELTLLPRPVAAAEAYAATDRVEVGQEIAVYSLGASRFEAAVLRRGAFGFELRAHADSSDVLGGALFDDLLAEHVAADLGELPETAGALAALRAACAEAKERLSTAVAVTIPTPPGSAKATVMVNRTDFDGLIRPVIEHTVQILQRAVQGAGSDALRAVMLVGGSAHVPLIAELVSAAVRVRVVAAEDPTTAVARGAALAGGRVAKPTVQARPVQVSPTVTPSAQLTQHTDLMRFDDIGPELADIGPPPPRPPVEIPALDPPVTGLARLTRRGRGGTEVDELDRERRSLDLTDDSAELERSDVRAVRTDDPPRRRRRIDPDEDAE
jgi:molecular chaperone DnaK (HSP70)